MIHPDEAWRRIAARLAPLPSETLPRRQALGRVLAHSLAATVDVPHLDVSAMDGYALSGAVPPGEPRPVAGTVAAGDPPGFELLSPAVIRIMTGAPVPLGADRIVPVEQSDAGLETAIFLAEAKAGDHIRRQGEVLRTGDPLLPAGAILTPEALALIATHGYPELPVHRAPTVAILTTGDEVVPPEAEPAPGQIRDSHTDFLLSSGQQLGLRFRSLGIAPDRVDELRALAEEGLRSDVLILCGGVSMGEFDLVEGVLAELGCKAHFDAVAIQPGKPMVFATHANGLVFGLPGNPAAVMVAFRLFVRPALKRLMGIQEDWWEGLTGTLAAPLPNATTRDRFLPAQVE
ncbi:MAG TPA: molybdopterin molybdotransferase MoeA, partial [Thermoanaerobaculia bacterium]|nr:molybdopterin molybdotransferase MoeA [Thermoanaerobaculia bacterium]